MELHEIRRAIRAELLKDNPDEALITRLIRQRDEAQAKQPKAPALDSVEQHARMLDYTYC